MAITILKQAPTVCRVKNPVIFNLQTNNQYSSAGFNEVFIIQYALDPDENDTLEFGVNQQLFVFTHKTSPNNSGTQIPRRGALSIENYVKSVVEYLRRNYTMNNWFFIEAIEILGTWCIRFTSRVKSQAYTFMSFASTNGRFVFYSQIGGFDPIKRPNFHIVLQVWVKTASGDVLAGEEWIKPDADGNARFNVSEYLQPLIVPEFRWPSVNIATNYPNLLRRFFIRYGEAWGDPPAVQGMVESSEMIAIPGKENDYTFEEKYRQNDTNWSTYRTTFNVLGEFLTNQPRVKFIRKDDHERLFLPFVPESGFTGVLFVWKIEYTDGTTTTYSKNSSYNQDCVIEYNPSIYIHLLENIQPSKEIAKYDFYIRRPGGAIISDIFTFHINQEPEQHEHRLLIHSEKGGFDLVTLTGVKEIEGQYERDELIEGPSLENPMKRRKRFNYNTIGQDKIKANTGHLSLDKLNWLKEMFSAEEYGCWEIVNNELYPVNITSTSSSKVKDKDFTWQMTIEYTRPEVPLDTQRKVKIWEDLFTAAGVWLRTYDDLIGSNPDWYFVGSGYGYQYRSQTSFFGALAWPSAFNFLLSNTKYEVEIDVENYYAYDMAITPVITGIWGDQEIVNNERRIIRQTFITNADPVNDIILQIENVNGTLNWDRQLYIRSIKISKCLE